MLPTSVRLMPTITQANHIEIKPEAFVNACSDVELYGLWLLMNSAAIQRRLLVIENAGVDEEAKEITKEI
jgi:hypothetical protein